MQSAINASSENDTNLVTAQVLREMTVSQESIKKRQKDSIMDSLMSTMVKMATEAGKSTYTAHLNPEFDQVMLNEIVTELQGLGYTVLNEAKTDPKMGPMISLTISW